MSDGIKVGSVSISRPVVPTADRVDLLFSLSLEVMVVETITAQRTAIVIARMANDFFVDQAIFPFVVIKKEWALL
jgi:hypothetical protein